MKSTGVINGRMLSMSRDKKGNNSSKGSNRWNIGKYRYRCFHCHVIKWGITHLRNQKGETGVDIRMDVFNFTWLKRGMLLLRIWKGEAGVNTQSANANKRKILRRSGEGEKGSCLPWSKEGEGAYIFEWNKCLWVKYTDRCFHYHVIKREIIYQRIRKGETVVNIRIEVCIFMW